MRAVPAVGSAARERKRDDGPDAFGEAVPEHGRGVQQEEVHLAPGGNGVEDVEVAGGEPGEPEEGETWGQVEQGRVVPQAPARLDQALGRARLADAVAQQEPELDLPGRLVRTTGPGDPALEHVGSVHGVAIEEVGDVADAREALRLLDRLRIADVLRQRREPGIVEVFRHHFHQRPDGALGLPRVLGGLHPRCERQRARDQGSGERERGRWHTRRRGRRAACRGAPTAVA